ncbi:MAG: tail protein X [Aequoribacter sp.]|uniref:tail protein X n=1 Tax=Aequoribacter sp. TaxID=2847771 RepID=UPI003C3C6B64
MNTDAKYRTRQGDMLDRICLEFYGYSSEAVEVVLKHNPGLAALGPVYEAGVIIELPQLKLKGKIDRVRLWD